jgi:putative secretion ATPase (PEP-CTERM system associated)
MYERFYHLRDRPFALSPDPDYLYPSRVHREALDYLRFGIEGHAGFVVITGEIGSGKTTLLQVLLRNLDGQTTVVRLVNTLLTGNELLESILLDLGVDEPPMTKPGMLRELARVLIEQRRAGRRVVVVIDEAQNLSHEALEELRMLSNLETEKSKLIQIVLVGQPDLRDSLERPTLEQLRQRVTVRYHINPLDAPETARYINHRLKRAAVAAPLEFPSEVTEMIHARSGGVPRLINVICDGVLLCGYAEECRVINLPLVHAAIEELESSSVLRRVSNSAMTAPRDPGDSGSSQRPASPPPAASQPPKPMPLADMPLRRTQEPPLGPQPIRREPVVVGSAVAAPRNNLTTLPVSPGRAPGAPEFRRQPVAFRPELARAASAWNRVKEVFFGLRTETGRR